MAACSHLDSVELLELRHATAHHTATGHPIIRSAEPREQWSWCHVGELMFRLRPT
jgi:hypothetical protein